MSDDVTDEKLEEMPDTPTEPLEVKITNQPKKEITPYDEIEDVMYENMYPTDEQIKEYEEEDGNTSSK